MFAITLFTFFVEQVVGKFNNVLTYYNGNYTVRPADYNNSSKVKVQMWGDNAVNLGLINVFGSSGGFIEAEIHTHTNKTFHIQTGSNILRQGVISLYNGYPSILSSSNLLLIAGGGTWMQTYCNVYELCFVAFGGLNTLMVNNHTHITANFNGTNELRPNSGMIKLYY